MSNGDKAHGLGYYIFWTVASIAAFGFLFYQFAQYLAS